MPTDVYSEVAHSLAALGYRETLSRESLPLVDKLLADFLLLSENYQQSKAQNATLHQELDQLRVDNDVISRDQTKSRGASSEDGQSADQHAPSLSSVLAENKDLHFLLAQLRKQLSDTESRLYSMQRLQPEPRTKVVFSGECNASSSGIGSGSEFGCSAMTQQPHMASARSGNSDSSVNAASSARTPTIQPLDLLSAAERKIMVLEEELQQAVHDRVTVEGQLQAAVQKLECREDEIGALERRLARTGDTRSVSSAGRSDCDTVPVRLSAGSASTDAARRGSDAAPAKKQTVAELRRQNTALKQQLEEAISCQHEAMQRCLKLAADEQTAVRQLEHERERAERFHRELHDLNSIAQAMQSPREVRDAAVSTESLLPATVAVGVQTCSEHSSASPPPCPTLPSPPPCHTCSALERQLERLLLRLADGGATAARGSDGGATSGHDPAPTAALQHELLEARSRATERDQQVQALRQQLDDALRAIHKMSETITTDNTIGSSTEETVSPAPHQCCQAVSGQHLAALDDLDDVRVRLKLATQHHQADRQRLEGRLGELETLLEDAERDKHVLSAQLETGAARSRSLEAQVKNLQNQLSFSQAEVTKLVSHRDKTRNVVNRSETTLKSCESELIQTKQRLEKEKDVREGLERRCSLLSDQMERLTSQLDQARTALQKLVSERDSLQNEVDNKVVALDRQCGQLEKQHDELVQQQVEVQRLNALLSKCRAQNVHLEQSRSELEEQARQARAQLSAGGTERGLLEERNAQLQSDLASCTAQLSRLKQKDSEAEQQHEELQSQVREYVSEVARVEQLLSERDEQRDHLLRQYRDLSMEVNGLEETNVSLNSELASLRAQVSAGLKELQLANDTISELDRRLESSSVAKQMSQSSSDRLQESLSDVTRRLELSQSECDRLQRDLSSSRQLSVRIDSDKDKFAQMAADKDAQIQTLQGELDSVRCELDSVRRFLQSERATCAELQTLLATVRQRQHDTETSSAVRDQQLQQLQLRCEQLQNQVESEREERARVQSQLEESGVALSRAQRQLTDERFERERLRDTLTSSSNSTGSALLASHYGSSLTTPAVAPPVAPRHATTAALSGHTSHFTPASLRHTALSTAAGTTAGYSREARHMTSPVAPAAAQSGGNSSLNGLSTLYRPDTL